uniref:DUF192 domain-containing protein n=1 Tax=Chlorobium phaeobacteroides (strain BS1) TaxID=331678 RepID=B3EJ17_CHLPB
MKHKTKIITQAISIMLIMNLLSCYTSTYQDDKHNKISQVRINSERISVEIADSDEEISRGLMWRKTLDREKGMLFIYPDNAVRYFWMKNTYIKLDMAFIDANHVIRTIHTADRIGDEKTLYSSLVPVQYVLEVNAGWFKQHNIGIGDTVYFDTMPSVHIDTCRINQNN